MKPKLLHLVLTKNGGAGKAASSLYLKLKSLGYASQMITLHPSVINKETTHVKLSFRIKVVRKILKALFGYKKSKNLDYNMAGIDETITIINSRIVCNEIKIKPDFIFVYWISGFLNAKNLYELQRKYDATIILHLTDMVSFTGGCHFALSCFNYNKGCGSCPGIFSTDPLDHSRKVSTFKKKYYDRTKMAVVVGTSNLEKQVMGSYLLKNKPIYNIKYHLNIDEFIQLDKNNLRKKYEIANDKKVIFFGATQLNQKRKGFDYLIESLNNLYSQLDVKNREKIVLLIAGSNDEYLLNSLPFNYISLGLIKNAQDFLETYQLSDVYLNTSIDDIGPYMLIEAMLSKCLVVSYDVGIATDLIINNETGFLNKTKDYISYSSSIFKAI